MKIYRLRRSQKFNLTKEQAWEFFSDPKNLELITPKSLKLKIKNRLPRYIHPGLLIILNIKPLFGIPMTWVTEVTYEEEPVFFIDQQRIGPFKFWHHQHMFTETYNGIEMEDVVYYSMKFRMLGRIIHSLFIKRKLKKIFDYKEQILNQVINQGKK